MTAPLHATTPGGFLLVLAVMLPVCAVLAILACGPRSTVRVALATLAAGLAVAVAVAVELVSSGAALTYIVGGWRPPLGIALRADGLSGAMLLMTALVVVAVGLFAHVQYGLREHTGSERAQTTFWLMLLALWSALNIVFVGEDLFNLYVALELLTFAAVPLVCLDGRTETVNAALRYLLFALLGSLLYLLGVGLIYGQYGTLDLLALSRQSRSEPALSVALALMIVGLLAKAALFPLHLWLPPAHAGAPAQASAVLSALVIKAPIFLIRRPGAGGVSRRSIARGARRGLDPVLQRHGAPAGTAEADDRLFDGRADRLSLHRLSARGRRRRQAALGDDRLDRRRAAIDLARARQIRDVPGGGHRHQGLRS